MGDRALLLDVSRLLWRAWGRRLPTGIDRTALAYVGHFRDRARAVVQRGSSTSVLSQAASRRLFDLLLADGADVRTRLLDIGGAIAAGVWRSRLAGQVYLNVGHTGLDRSGHARWLRRTGVQPVYFVHDLIPLTHPEFCRPEEPDRHLRRMLAMLRNGAGIIANSRSTVNELAIFSGLQKDLHMPPALVAPLGVAPPAQGAEAPVVLPANPHFVMVGTIEGRKNHLLILTLWAELARRLGPRCPRLVIIGQRGWESEQAVDMLERCEVLRGQVIELPRCSDERLFDYVRGARALLFPSFVEGYGLPLVEALSCGTPVIASDLAVFRELAGDIPDYLSPIDGLGWMGAIEDYAAPGSRLRADQLRRMQGWRAPDWPGHFALVERWLDRFSR